jgi:hypothetical protein
VLATGQTEWRKARLENLSCSGTQYPELYMESEDQLTFSQEHATALCPAAYEFSLHPPTSHPTYLICILLISTVLYLRPPSRLLHSYFPAKILYTVPIHPMRATFPVYFIVLDFSTQPFRAEL